MQKPMLSQNDSVFFKLPVEIRERIYVVDKDVIAKLEQTCQRIHAEVDVLVDAESMAKDMSAWSQIRKCTYDSVNLLPLKKPQTAKILCGNAFALHSIKKELIEIMDEITESREDSDKQEALMLDLKDKQKYHRDLLDAEFYGKNLVELSKPKPAGLG